MNDSNASPSPDLSPPIFVVEFADLSGEGWGKTAAILLRYFLEMRKLYGRIEVENTGTRVNALNEFDAGQADLKPAELQYAIKRGHDLNENLPPEERFLVPDDTVKTRDFYELSQSMQLMLLDRKQTPITTLLPLRIREIARKCIRKLRQMEAELQKNSIQWLARDLDERILAIAEAARGEPRQTRESPNRRLILTMTESDLTAIYSLGQNCNSVYDMKKRVIGREEVHRLLAKKYEALASLLDPGKKNDPVVVARLLYFVEGKNDHFKNPWEIEPSAHLPYSRHLQELVRQVADGLQFGLRSERVIRLLQGGSDPSPGTPPALTGTPDN